MIKPLEIQVRFSDCDMMGHVNNAVYLNYFEQTRLHYFEQLVGLNWDWTTSGIILKINEIEYMEPLFLHEKPIIYLKLKHLGGKSFTLAYELFVKEKLKTKGSSLIVCYDFSKNQSIEMKPELREALMKLEKV